MKLARQAAKLGTIKSKKLQGEKNERVTKTGRDSQLGHKGVSNARLAARGIERVKVPIHSKDSCLGKVKKHRE